MRIAIFSYDAGGGELIAAFVREFSKNQFLCLVEGPSNEVFRKRLPRQKRTNFSSMKAKLDKFKPQLAIATGNWGSKRQFEFWSWALKNKIKTVLYLERWPLSNAFLKGGRSRPEEIWLCDHKMPSSKEISELQLESSVFKRKINYYLKNQIRNVENLRKKIKSSAGEKRFLYIAENISTAEKAMGLRPKALRGYDEFEALEFFLRKVGSLSKAEDRLKIRIRPHPSEPGDKYLSIFKKFKAFRISLSPKSSSLEEDLAWCTLVVGTESNALKVARVCRRPVKRMIPPV